MTFGQRLSAARLRAGLTQDGLGKTLGTDGTDAAKSVVLGWEKDRHYPRVDQLALICQKLGVSADHLVFGVEMSWPFERVPLERVLLLSDADRSYVEGRLEAALDSLTQPPPAQPFKSMELRTTPAGRRKSA